MLFGCFETWFGVCDQVSYFSVSLLKQQEEIIASTHAAPEVHPIDTLSRIIDDAFQDTKPLSRARAHDRSTPESSDLLREQRMQVSHTC